MANEDAIWIGRDGQKYGPYTEADIRQWLREGQVTPDTLAWREGMADWQPLSTFFIEPTSATPPSPPPPPFSPLGSAYAGGPVLPMDEREAFPRPPSMHWFIVVVLSAITLGIFGWIWFFKQANWVKRIDPASKATTLFTIALPCALIGGALGNEQLDPTTQTVGSVLALAAAIIVLVACFGMAGSLRREAARLRLPLAIGGVTLFIFQNFYLQGQLTWLARWKDTGQTEPPAPKASFYLLLLIPVALLLLLHGMSTR